MNGKDTSCLRRTERSFRPVIWCLAGLALWAQALPAHALVLSGSSRTSIYAMKSRLGATPFEVRNPNGTLRDLQGRTQLLETVRLDALRLFHPSVSFHTALTASNVVSSQSAKDTAFRLYRAYLQNTGSAAGVGYDLRLGRQWVLAGVGTGVVDGVSLGLSRNRWGGLDGFVGTLGADRMTRTRTVWGLDKPSRSLAFGGRLRFDRELGRIAPSLAVSFAQAERTPHQERVTDAQRVGVHGRLGFARQGDTRTALDGVRLYGDWERDLILGRTVWTTGGAEFQGTPRNLFVWAEYDRRRPDFRVTDFFAAFDSRPMDEVRAGVGADVIRGLRASIDGDLYTFSDSQTEKGARLLLSWQGFTVGYRLHGGWGGDLSGLVAYGHREIGDRLTVDASINRTVYKYGTVDGNGNDAVDQNESTGILALGYRLLDKLTVTGQVEGLRNAAYKSDVRFLGMLDWRFRTVI